MSKEVINMSVEELFGPDSGIELSVISESSSKEPSGNVGVKTNKSSNDMDAVIQKLYHQKDNKVIDENDSKKEEE